jgi:hypothetical protein
VNEPPRLRFAVGIFGGWPDLEACVGELTAAGMVQSAFNLLGLRRVLAPVAERSSDHLRLRELPFPGNKELVAGTTGPVAERLAMRLVADGDTLRSALAHWLIPRHAAQLEEAVAAGKIVLWVQLFDNDDERRAYRSLLARSSNAVGVHDLVGG